MPARRGIGTRIEVRIPDPSCNPYLALAVMLRCGLDGIAGRIDPGEPVNKDIFKMSEREKRRLKIDSLPADLNQAIQAMQKDAVVMDALGPHIATHYVEAKQAAWKEFIAQVHPWELERYLGRF